MSTAEKLRVMEEIWDSLRREGNGALSMPSWHADVLADRGGAADASKMEFADWATVRDRLRKKYE